MIYNIHFIVNLILFSFIKQSLMILHEYYFLKNFISFKIRLYLIQVNWWIKNLFCLMSTCKLINIYIFEALTFPPTSEYADHTINTRSSPNNFRCLFYYWEWATKSWSCSWKQNRCHLQSQRCELGNTIYCAKVLWSNGRNHGSNITCNGCNSSLNWCYNSIYLGTN